jgi:hypothetical protein
VSPSRLTGPVTLTCLSVRLMLIMFYSPWFVRMFDNYIRHFNGIFVKLNCIEFNITAES